MGKCLFESVRSYQTMMKLYTCDLWGQTTIERNPCFIWLANQQTTSKISRATKGRIFETIHTWFDVTIIAFYWFFVLVKYQLLVFVKCKQSATGRPLGCTQIITFIILLIDIYYFYESVKKPYYVSKTISLDSFFPTYVFFDD